MIREIDRSLPVPLPPDRPLTRLERAILFKDVLPPVLRQGEYPGPKDPGFREHWDAHRAATDAVLGRYGWLLNRLDWDAEWTGGPELYEVPDFCQPGGARYSRSKMARHRREVQDIPPMRLEDARGLGGERHARMREERSGG